MPRPAMAAGNEPPLKLKRLPLRSIVRMEPRPAPHCVGREPLSKLLWTERNRSRLSRAISEGSVPLRAFDDRSIDSSDVRRASSVGSVPLIKWPPSMMCRMPASYPSSVGSVPLIGPSVAKLSSSPLEVRAKRRNTSLKLDCEMIPTSSCQRSTSSRPLPLPAAPSS